jgi:integrase
MRVAHLEILVEEPSMEAALRLVVPRIVRDLSFEVYPYQGKADLLRRLPERLQGYAKWLRPNWRIVVLVDRDDDDCKRLKRRLEEMARDARLLTRSASRSNAYTVVNRMAIEELEAWYFGDWAAVQAAYPRVPVNVPAKAKYRLPDAVKGGTWEAFERILQRAGYFKGGLRKIEAARAVAEHWVPTRNTSVSFRAFRNMLEELAQ